MDEIEEYRVEIDDDFHVQTSGLPRCNLNEVPAGSVSPAEVYDTCGPPGGTSENALIGTGRMDLLRDDIFLQEAILYLYNGPPTAQDLPTTRLVIDWNGADPMDAGEPVTDPPGADLGVGFTFDALENFHVGDTSLIIYREFQVGGDERSYLKVKCADANQLWNYGAVFDFESTTDSSLTSTTACTTP